MKLLNTTTFQMETSPPGRVFQEPYAILSHRWLGNLGNQEIKPQDLDVHRSELISGKRPLSLPQLDKIRGACDVARLKGFEWLWIDTCCIDRTDAREYAEAIHSMYEWYRKAKLCITYLADVESSTEIVFRSQHIFRGASGSFSEWFARGWTLQELLAPPHLEFYDRNWKYMGTKKELAIALAKITGIETAYLTGERHISEACVAVKMSWMSSRETTYPEDIAYSMIGIFNINMPVIYGEGGLRAFERLQEILLTHPSMDESLFAWKMPDLNAGRDCDTMLAGWDPGEWGLLAGSPKWFMHSGDVRIDMAKGCPSRGFRMTAKGLEGPIRRKIKRGPILHLITASVVIISATIIGIPLAFALMNIWNHQIDKKAMKEYAYTLNCYRICPSGQRLHLTVYLRPAYADSVSKRDVDNIVKPNDNPKKVVPYIECKRIRCNELGVDSKHLTRYGDGIIYQPQPGY